MLRALWFFAKISLLMLAVIWLLQRPGTVSVTWLGYQIDTTVGFVFASLLGLLFVWTLAYDIFRAIVDVPLVFKRWQETKRREDGYRAVTAGLVAIAAGDAVAAEKNRVRAENMIPHAPLTRLLSAQSALLSGNAPKARREFTALLDDSEGAFFGLRGLLSESLKDRNYAEALTLARRAEAMQPRRFWILRTLFDLETRNREWESAAKTLKKSMRLGAVDKRQGILHHQALLLAQGMDAAMAGDARRGEDFFARSFALDHSFSPAAIKLAQAYVSSGQRRAAVRTIQKSWREQPHPDLAALWMSLAPLPKKTTSVYDAGKQDYAWANELAEARPDHRESLRLLGQAALGARMWGEARTHLSQAADYRGLARLEREEMKNEARAREWLEKAADAPPPTLWVCSSCTSGHAAWTPLCPQCGVFGMQEWVTPNAESAVAALPEISGDLLAPPDSPLSQGRWR